jgi:hypothetical protein
MPGRECETPSPPVILSKHEGALATEGASKDTEDVSSALPIRGVLTKRGSG